MHIGYVNLALNHVSLVPDMHSLRELGSCQISCVAFIYLSMR